MLLIILTFFTLLFWCVYLRFSREGRLIAKIPGPKGIPILGNAFDFLGPPEKVFKKTRDLYKTYKGIVLLYTFNFRSVNIYDPDDVAILLSSTKYNDKNIPYTFLTPLFGDGLVTSTGSKWLHRRKMLTPAFHLNALKKFTPIFVKHVGELTKTLEPEVIKDKTDIYKFIKYMNLQMICESSIGLSKSKSLDDMFDKYSYAIDMFMHCLVLRLCRVWYFFDWSFNISSVGRKQRKIQKDLHDFSKEIIDERRQMLNKHLTYHVDNEGEKFDGKNITTMMDLLLKYEKENIIDEAGIHEEVETFLFAGHDTIAIALVNFIMRIANEPKIQEKVHEEIDRIFENSDRAPTMDDLNEMKYIECCIKECLRIYPSAPFISRYLKKEIVLGGYTIPAYTYANIMIYDIHHRPDLYPEPEKFIPERFTYINQKTTGDSKRHPYAYIPFSAGPRNCIGQKYAMLQMKTTISGLFRKYCFEPVTRPEDMVFVTELILKTKEPIYVKIRYRN